MASDKGYLQFVLGQLSTLEEITYRPMMGEYILYYRGRIFGGIYDNRLLVKPVEAAVAMTENPVFQPPYDGAKDMLLVENVDDVQFLTQLVEAMYSQLPPAKRKK